MIANYFKGAFAYGFVRKILYIKDIKEYENYKNEKRPVLITDYLINGCAGGIMSFLYFPFFLLNDIRVIEMKIKEIKLVSDYDENKNTFESVLNNNHLYK